MGAREGVGMVGGGIGEEVITIIYIYIIIAKCMMIILPIFLIIISPPSPEI